LVKKGTNDSEQFGSWKTICSKGVSWRISAPLREQSLPEASENEYERIKTIITASSTRPPILLIFSFLLLIAIQMKRKFRLKRQRLFEILLHHKVAIARIEEISFFDIDWGLRLVSFPNW
jgi:hypothetical protein